jgi:hypothetical protein
VKHSSPYSKEWTRNCCLMRNVTFDLDGDLDLDLDEECDFRFRFRFVIITEIICSSKGCLYCDATCLVSFLIFCYLF